MDRRTMAACAAALALPLGLVACGGSESEDAGTATTPPATTQMTMEMGGAAAVSIESPATDLRVTLDRLLAEHALLAAFAMQKGVGGEEDFEAIAGALDANTVDLGEAVGSVYGAEAETAFLKLWRQHIGFFVDYTVATAKDDEAGKTKARDALAGYQADFSEFLDGATGGELPQSAAAEALGAHVSQLVDAIDTYASGEYDTAYGEVREAYHHMFMTGDALAGAIVAQSPEKFEG